MVQKKLIMYSKIHTTGMHTRKARHGYNHCLMFASTLVVEKSSIVQFAPIKEKMDIKRGIRISQMKI